MRPIIYPYNMGSRSSRALCRLLKDLRCNRVFPDKRYKYYNNHIIINWGNALKPRWHEPRVKYVNNPDNVSVASHKLLTFQKLQEKGVAIPKFTTSQREASEWVANGGVVYERHYLRGSQGRGIRIVEHVDNIRPAPLYTSAIPFRGEYRVHVFNNDIISYQKKRRDTEALEEGAIDEYIRSHSNGWVFCRDNLEPLPDNNDLAKRAVSALGLTFGAVDIIRSVDRHSYVLEVNSAPGLEGETLLSYNIAIRKYLDEY